MMVPSIKIKNDPSLYKWKPLSLVLVSIATILTFVKLGLDLPLNRDNAIYMYSGLKMLDGLAPFQSIFDVKSPGTSFAVAFFAYIANLFSINYIIGVRLGFMGISLLSVVLTYFLAERIFGSRRDLFVVPLSMLGFHSFVYYSAMGARPKALLVLFLVFFLIKAWDKNWFVAGAFASLCALTWQPAGITALTLLLFALLQPKEQKLKSVFMTILGGFSVALVFSGYFLYHGAFMDFIDGTFMVQGFMERRETSSATYNMIKWVRLDFMFMSGFIILGLPLLVFFLIKELKKQPLKKIFSHPFFLYLLFLGLILLWSISDFQGSPDFFIFLPFASLGIYLIFNSLYCTFSNRGKAEDSPENNFVLFAILVFVLIIPPLNHYVSRNDGGLKAQKKLYKTSIQKVLKKKNMGGKNIAVIEVPEILALLEFDSITPYVVNGSGIDNYVAHKFNEGFSGWLNDLSNKEPDLVIVRDIQTRNYSDNHSQLFENWLKESYIKDFSNPYFQIWVKATNQNL